MRPYQTFRCNTIWTKYRRTPLSRPVIREWYQKFRETVSVLQQTGSGQANTSAKDVQRIQESFMRSPQQSIIGAAVNCKYHAQQCTRHYTHTWDCTHTRFKLCRLSVPIINCYICICHRHSGTTGWRHWIPKTCGIYWHGYLPCLGYSQMPQR